MAPAMALAAESSWSVAPVPAVMPLPDNPDRMAVTVARMVGGIFAYTRWPAARSTIGLCITGVADHAGELDSIAPDAGRPAVQRRALPPGEGPLPAHCDALYLGDMDLSQARRLIAAAHGAPLVTIAESDAGCRAGAMFCLLFAPGNLNFRLNIDAVSRSTVRIDPRVLRMSRDEG
jgi:hypothetical protein